MTQNLCLDKNWLDEYPPVILRGIRKLAGRSPELYVAGGAVRDWLGSVRAADLDITLAGDAIGAARLFAAETGGAFVLLDLEEGVARVVLDGLDVDIASFREGSTTIIDDLSRRDFTINAMAVAIDPATGGLAPPFTLIDPLGGADDLRLELVRAPAPEVFDNDPLRLLRAYRFAARLGFAIEARTGSWIYEKSGSIGRPAPERIRYELELIMASDRAAEAFRQMHQAGLLAGIFPELIHGEGLDQPASHHLDVFSHNLAALAAMEKIIGAPAGYYPQHIDHFLDYLAVPPRPVLLKWAAVFHDLGKPETCGLKEDGRTTFYNHDRAGAKIFTGIARRLRWSREQLDLVAGLIELHMYPFHLSNAMARTGISPKACLKLVKAAGAELPGLFLLAMADSLASQGPLRPPDMEKGLAQLYDLVDQTYRDSIQPVLAGEPLVTGNDLKEIGLKPGPLFGLILDGLEEARVEGEVHDRQEALVWVRDFLAARAKG